MYALALLAVCPAQIITNGSFETPDTAASQVISAGQTALTGWSVISGSVRLTDAVGNGTLSGAAAAGAQYLNLDAGQPGQIRQSFNVVTSSPLGPPSYRLFFSYANDYVNAPGGASFSVRVFDASGDRYTTGSLSHTTSAPDNLAWTSFASGTGFPLDFIFLSSPATVEFTSLSSAGSGGGILLDDVRFVAVPEPSTLLLVGVAAAGWAWRCRSRGKRAAPPAPGVLSS